VGVFKAWPTIQGIAFVPADRRALIAAHAPGSFTGSAPSIPDRTRDRQISRNQNETRLPRTSGSSTFPPSKARPIHSTTPTRASSPRARAGVDRFT
jgi:hypothetical protein